MSPVGPPSLINDLKSAFGFSTVQLDSKTNLPQGERTGFDDLIDLRNVFRGYNMAKLDPELSSNVVMIWKNGKEGEYYVVEPISFKTSRDSSSPLTANYTIVLKTIKRWEVSLVSNIVSDAFLNRNEISGLGARIKGIINGISQSLNIINNHLDGALSHAARIINRVITPANEILAGVVKLSSTSKRLTEIPRAAIVSVASNAREAASALSEANSSFQNSVIEVNNAYGAIKSALGTLARTMLRLSNEDSLFAPTPETKVNTKKLQIANNVFLPAADGGDPLAISNIRIGNSTSQASVGPNDDIRKLAKRLLGSASRWKELVITNNLKAPYISVDGNGIDVLRPGDNIIYPTRAASAKTAVAAETIGKARTISPIEERLGRDIELVSPVSSSGITQFDFAVDKNGDIKLIEGVPNLKQAIRIKFETEQGELSLHPFFGIRYPLGVKIPGAAGFTEFDVNARATLLSDQRIGNINRLDISFVGNTLLVKGDVFVKGFDSALGFDFSTRR